MARALKKAKFLPATHIYLFFYQLKLIVNYTPKINSVPLYAYVKYMFGKLKLEGEKVLLLVFD